MCDSDKTIDRIKQMKAVHTQADLQEYAQNYYHFTNSIPQLELLNSQLKGELKIVTNSISFPEKFGLDIKSLLLSMHTITGKILSEKKNMTIEEIRNTALELFARKNADYGDAFAEYGLLGVIVRIGDKVFRLKTLTENNTKTLQVKEESINDTLEDLFNYSAMAVMLYNSKE